ncbi:putative transferase, protein kinase RLK-Pelle-WAK family [Rosa chinensis]|uniref:Putative transferase, protein kinase RLK-Pelle-WAK family n=1 Tax=Rosa chinensis TaxID=74649 RepID=A0A2P6S0J1_ROSCH|nr:wall-associated receptor kinase-like 1 [Rosa chinensis]PRQ52202.1 putative transferase, protein kinase RLK-Pelle-WAK family [Rosa chinensis]
MQSLVHHMISIMVLCLWSLSTTPAVAAESGTALPIAKPNCQEKCGNVSIPYPFGIGPDKDCYLEEWFEIDCNQSTRHKPFLRLTQQEVLSISIKDGTLQVNSPVTFFCNVTGSSQPANLTGSPFVYSQRQNRFTAATCGFVSLVSSDQSVVGGCRSICDKQNTGRYSDGCDIGTNCCQTSIPPYLRVVTASVMVDGPANMTGRNDSGKPDCSDYAFLVDKDWFETASNYSAIRNMLHVPVALEWSVINDTNSSSAFQGNKKCDFDTSLALNRSVLSCRCPQGFDGNPYLLQPCQDIDECIDGTKRCWPGSKCMNLPGSFKCEDEKDTIKLALAGLGSSLGLLLLLIAAWWVHKLVKKRKSIKRKEMSFKRNGGLLLERQLSSGEVNLEKIKLFKSKELEKSTDNFHVDRILGKGGQGTVYKGMLTDGRIVAVKRSTKVDEGRLSQFINEVVILSQINHRNVVKLLGCCLETEVPLLVYEFIPNGSLSQYIHEQHEDFPLTWELRLRIATEIAGALSYLHGAASIPIFHRDIKSTNILLDEKYRAKIADFGTSRSVAIDQTHLTTLVYGTFGYLDPEYFQSSQFTDKSDVYSFGVVLVELLSGQKPISVTRSQEEGRSLATHFIILMQDDRLFEVVDARVLNEASKEDILLVANLARRCLHLNGRNRPTMREVTAELEGIQMSQKTTNGEQNYEEVDIVRYDSIEPWDVASTSTGTVTGTRSGVAAGPSSSPSQGIALLSL